MIDIRNLFETISFESRQLLSWLKKPTQLLLSLLLAGLILFILVWLTNMGLLFDLLLGPLPISAKWDVLASTPEILQTNYTLFQAWLLVVFSLLQGINLALLIYVIRGQSSRQKVQSGSRTSLATLFALGGAGCAACGTSILSPIVASAGSGAVVWAERFGLLILVAGTGLLIYSIRKLLPMLYVDKK